MRIKISDIKIIKTDGWYQLCIFDHVVTKEFRTENAAFKEYIKNLCNALNRAAKALDEYR